MHDERSPIMPVGKYAGTRVDALPMSYLRWMMTQKFPKHLLDAAQKKLSTSIYSNEYLQVSRHAYDRFSLRFLDRWLRVVRSGEKVGLGTYVARKALEAYEKGEDISKRRHQDDGIVRLYEGIKWVFNTSHDFPDYRDLITVMAADEESNPQVSS